MLRADHQAGVNCRKLDARRHSTFAGGNYRRQVRLPTIWPADERQVAAWFRDMTGTICRPYEYGCRRHTPAHDRDH
jgi:hypothetical protein